ncbi:MAG: polysaccharide biosynthesis C-terminal domain-containing protein [Polyangiaceae bacterium]
MSQPEPSAARRIVRNTASILLGDGAGEIFVGYAILLAAGSLGPAGFGRLSEAQAFMEPFDSLAALGLENVAMVVAARRGGCDEQLRGTVWGIRMMSACVAAVVGVSVAFATGRGSLYPILIALAIGMLVSPLSVVSLLPFQFHQTVHRRIAVPFVVGVVRLGCSYLAYWFLRLPVGFQLATLGASIVGAGVNWGWARRVYGGRLRFDKQLALSMLRLGWPAAALEFLVSLYMRAGYFFLHDAGASVQGQYAAADRLLKPVMAIAGAVFLSALPTVAGMVAARQFVDLIRTYRRSVFQAIFGFIPFAALAWVLAGALLQRFAPAYSGAILPFRILIIGAFFMFLNMLSTTYIVSLGQFRAMMIVSVFNLLVYLALATQLIPRYGAVGAAISTTVMEAINTVVQLNLVYRLLRRSMREAV